ncbi:MAG: hypothetical protein H7A55_10215 [Verrucomicrobiaceae bacterium]|nr:hypothetical protein [Verrucomicrobiaceae bacterium]
MKAITITLATFLFLSSANADDAEAVRKVFAQRDQELREKIESLESEMAQMTQRMAVLKTFLVGGPKEAEDGLVVVEVRSTETLVGNKPISVEELGEKLRIITAVNSHAWVRLVAAPDVTWAQLQPALQVCFDAKVATFEFLIKKP